MKGDVMSTTRKITIAVAAAVGVAGIAAGVAIGAVSVFGSKQTTRARISVPVQRIVVDGNAGDIELMASGRSGVEVTRTTSWLFSKPKVRQYVRAGVLHLESRCGHGFLCETDFHVRAPVGVAVEVSENAADVTVHGAPGNVSVDTNAGDVRVELERAPRQIDAETNAGDVRIVVPRGNYAVATHSNVGDETVRGLVRDDRAIRTIRASTNAGDVTVAGR